VISVPPRLMMSPGLVVTMRLYAGGVVTISLSPTQCRSVFDERFIWIAFGTSGWSKVLGRKALSILVGLFPPLTLVLVLSAVQA
jgi:hypothetical protein